MVWREALSLVTLLKQVNLAYPNRNKASDGAIGDAAHAATASDHNPNPAGVVCARDFTHDPSHGFDAHALADRLLANRHSSLKYIISNGRIAGAWTGWKWTKYSGSDPHDTHIHISVGVGEDGQSEQPYDDTTPWKGITIEEVAMPTEKDVRDHFNNFIHKEPTDSEVSFYTSHDWGTLNGALLQYMHDVMLPNLQGQITQLKAQATPAVTLKPGKYQVN